MTICIITLRNLFVILPAKHFVMHSFHHHELHISETKAMSRIMLFFRNWTLPISIVAGIVAYFVYVNISWFDSTHTTVAKIVSIVQPVFIFAMLFLTFLSIAPRDLRLRRWHFMHLVIQLSFFGLMVLIITLISDPEWRVIAESAMLCLLCPTATAAAVVTRKLGGNAADITSYTILINMAIAVTAPALLPIAHPHTGLSFFAALGMIMGKVFPILICPLLSAWIIRRFLPRLGEKLCRYKDLPFYLWAVSLALAIAVTVKAIAHSDVPVVYLIGIAAATFVCCIIQFYLGRLIGRKYGHKIEGSQALGQKNTVFIIWLGYTFLSPVTAVAGGFYSIWHNIYNSRQLYSHRKHTEQSPHEVQP